MTMARMGSQRNSTGDRSSAVLRSRATTAARRVTGALLGVALAFGGLGVATATAQPTRPAAGDRYQAPRATPRLTFSPGSWVNGNRVTIKITGAPVAERVQFLIIGRGLGPYGTNFEWLVHQSATANRAGVAVTTVTWPKGYPYYTVDVTTSSWDGLANMNVTQVNGRWQATNRDPSYNVTYSAPKFRSGQRVTLTARGVTPNKRVRFVFSSTREGRVLSNFGNWSAIADRNGLAKVTVTWPSVPVQRRVAYQLKASDGIGIEDFTDLVNNGGTWVPNGYVRGIEMSRDAVSAGDRVTASVSEAPAGKPVEFRVIAWRGDTPTVMIRRTVVATSSGKAALTVNWPAIATTTVNYSVEAVDAGGGRHVEWFGCEGGRCFDDAQLA